MAGGTWSLAAGEGGSEGKSLDPSPLGAAQTSQRGLWSSRTAGPSPQNPKGLSCSDPCSLRPGCLLRADLGSLWPRAFPSSVLGKLGLPPGGCEVELSLVPSCSALSAPRGSGQNSPGQSSTLTVSHTQPLPSPGRGSPRPRQVLQLLGSPGRSWGPRMQWGHSRGQGTVLAGSSPKGRWQ